ncbi:Dps family protein [Estrella lausannensis]|uniref:DNA protection during starvation protein n=1 Tax=Estrella lausannensis TaxID=483423 RepID=A0A0H5DNX9_9BACT|nr:DNA starvation/stationary phase protection protein [Estrella lausannensis]CRX38131.1 DNA protection during starvation protein [Estrella lausannensis]
MNSTTKEGTVSARQVQNLMTYLANTYVLLLKTHNYHWNVEGARFFTLHQLFEKQYQDLFEESDTVAERIRALGRKAPGTMRTFLKLATIREGDQEDLSENEMIEDLMRSHEELSTELHTYIAQAEEDKDQGTLDLFVQALRSHDKAVWMLRSHLLTN